MNIILGNITSFISCLFDSYSATKNNKKEMLIIQVFSVGVYAISNTLLKAYSAVVQNIFAIVRNLLAAKGINNRIVEYIIILGCLFFGVYFNNLGLLGLLPVFANVEYSICLFVLKDRLIGLKLSFLICNICFLILNFCISNYVGFVSNSITVITTIVELLKKDN